MLGMDAKVTCVIQPDPIRLMRLGRLCGSYFSCREVPAQEFQSWVTSQLSMTDLPSAWSTDNKHVDPGHIRSTDTHK